MRGAFGKPQGTVARVNIGQVIMSVRAKEMHEPMIVEALRRAKFKFPGRQKVCLFLNNSFVGKPLNGSCMNLLAFMLFCPVLSHSREVLMS